MITRESLEKLGMKQWQHPTKKDDVRYYFNIEYYKQYKTYKQYKNKEIIKAVKVYFDSDLTLHIRADNKEVDNLLEGVKDLIENLIAEKEENKQMINEVKEQISKEEEKEITSQNISDDELAQLIMNN
ncbi:hypothetical protein CDEF62S_03383 [Castellaniella defragrans]